MSVPKNELSKQEKITLLKRLIESEDVFYDNRSTFQEFLPDPDPEVRILAIQGLWDYPAPDLIDPLIDMAQRDPDQQVRNRAITALGRYVYEGEMADYDFDWGEMEAIIREDELPEESYRRVVAFLVDIPRHVLAVSANALRTKLIRDLCLNRLGYTWFDKRTKLKLRS